MIVDEEQRFGVKQKELLRQLKLQVDVLSMTATPIPRTLQMSLAGIRDISVIETPPRAAGRSTPTSASTTRSWSASAIAARDRRATARCSSCTTGSRRSTQAAERLRDLVPEARFAVGHGQMDERELEKVMLDFLARRGRRAGLHVDHRVRASTSPTANTLIVERADLFGLSQLYQIRGRVGRSRRARLRLPAATRPRRLTADAAAAAAHAVATTPSWARASRSPCATSRSAAPATCSATSSPATSRRRLRAVHADARRGGRASRAASRRGDDCRAGAPRGPVDAYVPADYIPYEQAKIDVHRRIARAGDPRAWTSCGPSSPTVSASRPSP